MLMHIICVHSIFSHPQGVALDAIVMVLFAGVPIEFSLYGIVASLPICPVKRCQRICEAKCMRQTATCFMHTESFAPQQWLPFFYAFCLTLPCRPINAASGAFLLIVLIH